jgi:hypothetical protein
MEWNVYYHNFNKRTIERWNIFNHGRFAEDVNKLLKEDVTKEELAEKLKGKLFYYFGHKAEYEVVITSWVPHIDKQELDRLNAEYEEHYKKWGKYPYRIYVNPDVGEKVDIYSQVWNNKDIFVDYVWSYKEKENEGI